MLRKRLAAVVLPVLLLCLSGEAYFRLSQPNLPSLVNKPATTPLLPTAPAFGCDFQLPKPDPRRPRGILFIGDSVTAGMGVDVTERFSSRLAQRFPEQEILNRGEAGADLCREILLAGQQLAEHTPEVLVWQVFADDLLQYVVYRRENDYFASPTQEDNFLLRGLAQSSYLFNFFWFQARLHLAPHRNLTATARSAIQTQLRTLATFLKESNTQVIPFLLEPAGWPNCPEYPRPGSICEWMRQDLQRLADIFEDAGLPPLDLRGLWNQQPPLLLPNERNARGDQLLPVHPNSQGHQVLADALTPALQAALQSP